ncbi:uncharacterized protein LOC143912621 [Arctopsyche grandis]|uniref:uncharacterized protein LOC143912621 n=1 Tax=Arctopsyche grandis TaxID=121162 RepID=UPI00406D7F7C
MDNALLEQEDINKAFEEEAERRARDLLERKDIAMDDSIGEREEAKYSPEEKSYVDEGSDREPSLSISEESEEEEEEDDFIKQPVLPVEPPKEKVLPKAGPRPMQKHVRNESMIRFSSGDFSDVKVPQKKQEEKIVETKEEIVTKEVSPTTKTEIRKETITSIEDRTKTVTTNEEIITVKEKDIAEAPLKEKISSFESKMLSEKTKAETEKFEHKVKLTEEALKKHEEMQKTTTEYTEEFILDQIRVHDSIMSEKLIEEQRQEKGKPADPGSPDLVSDFATEMMKVEETFRAAADHTSEKYTETYFKGTQHVPKTFTKAARTDSTIVQFSSEEDNEFLKKSTDSETETESQIVTVKQQIGLLEGQIGVAPLKLEKMTKEISSSDLGPKSPLTIHIERESATKFLEGEIHSIEHEAMKLIKETDVDTLRVDSLEDSLQISSDEDAQIQPTDDESESQIKDQLLDDNVTKSIDTKQTVNETKITSIETHARSDSMGSDFSKRSASEGPQIESSRSPKHLSQESPLPYSQATVDRTDSLADSVQSTERDMSYTSQSDSKVYSKDTRPTRSDSLDEASQFSDMEETQIGAPLFPGPDLTSIKMTTSSIRNDTMKFLESEYKFSSTELQEKSKKIEKNIPEEPAMSAKARQFIETVPEDDSSVHDCFFSKRIYSDSLEESEQYGTDNESRRPSEADSLKSDKSDQSGKDAPYKMSKISSEIEEGFDENVDSSVIIDDEPIEQVEPVEFEFVKMKADSKDIEDDGIISPPIVEETSDVAQDNLFKKMSITKRHSRNESISIIKFTPAELKDTEEKLIPPEIPKRVTEFQMFVTEAVDEFGDERISSFDKEELSDKISSESSREIEISEKKWSDGGASDKISSEDAVTDKRSSESIKEDLKISTDTLLGTDTKSPDLVVDDDFGSPTSPGLPKESPTLRKVDKVFTGLKELADQSETTLPKLEDTLKSFSQSPGMKRASLGSAGEGSYDLLAGKRASDALSISDSRDYTFEESEDSTPPKETKQELENRAKAILEPIYDKALRAVRGDSLDDVEPFCMDQENESPRLPGIQETQQAEILQQSSSTLTTDITVVKVDSKEMNVPLTMDIAKDVDKDYSVQSSPDEVEEKICTDTESELDQAKVLEIIEPTSDGDNGFVPSFDTSRIKQDSLDDADDFFAEKEGMFDDSEISTQQVTTETKPDGILVTTTTTTIHKIITGPVEEVTKAVESEIIESISQTTEILTKDLEIIKSKLEGSEAKDESIKSESLTDDEKETEKDDYISRSISEIGAAVAASIGIDIKSEDLGATKENLIQQTTTTLKSSSSKDSTTHKEHHVTEIITDKSSTTSSAGIDVKSEDFDATKESTIQQTTTLKSSSSKDSTTHQHHVTELITDISSTIVSSAGIEIKPEGVHQKKIEHDHSITELISDASITLAASVGVDVKSEQDEKEAEKDFSVQKISTKETIIKHPVVELLSDASTTLAASVGLELRHEGEEIKHGHPITELLSDSSSTLAAAVGIDFKPERDMFLDDDDEETSKTHKEVLSESKIVSSINTTVDYTEQIAEKIDSKMADKKRMEIQIESKDDEASPELSPDGLDDREKIVSEIKDLNRSDRRCSDLLEGISQPGGSLIRIDTSHVAHELSLKFSKTPPPSPVDLINRGASADLTGQQRKGPDVHTLDQASKLSPRDARFIKEIVSSDGDRLHSGHISEATKGLSRSSSPKSPIRHHSGDIAFVNVDTLTMHPDTINQTSILEQSTTKLISKDSKIVTEVITTKSDTFKVDERLDSTLIGADSFRSSFDDAKATFKEETRKKFEDIKKDFKDDVVVKFEHLKQEFDDKKKMFEDFNKDDDATMIITKKESTTHQISGKEVFSEKKKISSSDEDSIISAKIETKHEISGEEYELKEKESFEKSGDTIRTERSSVERDQKASAERRDSEVQKAKKGDDDSAVIVTHREFSEQGLYSGRQSKSEEKMTSIKDEVSRKSEVSYSERDLSHEQWGKEYFAERTELEPTEEVDAEFSQEQDVHIESAVRIVEKDEKLISEEITQSGKVVSVTTGFSKEESIVESKEHDDMSSDISQDTSFKSEVAGKRDSFDEKSEMSPKSRSRSLKKEEVYEVDFIKEIKVSTSQKSKGSSQEISQDTHSESEMIGESDFIGIPQLDLIPDDDKKSDISKSKKEQINLEKKISPVHKSEEHIQEHVWEVSLQQQESLDEVASDLHQQSKSFCEEPKSVEIDFVSQSESKSLTSGSDLGITTLASDLDLRISQSGISVTSSDETFCAEAPSEALDSFKDSMIKSRESIETEYMIKSIDSQDTETLQKSMESMSAETMQHSEKEDFSTDTDFFTTDLHQKRIEQKLLKEKSLEDICSSGYDTDLSSAEFLASKLEHERVDVEPLRPQPLAELSDLEKTIDEVKQSLEAAHGEIINEKSDGSIKYKQSPSEFEFKLISPDRPEVIHEEPLQHPDIITKQEQEVTVSRTVTSEIKSQTSVSSKSGEETHEVKKDFPDIREEYSIHSRTVEFSIGEKDISTSTKETDSSSKQDDTCFTSDEEKDTAQEKDKYMLTQHEISDISTGLESGPISLLDNEAEMASDKEESPKDSSDSIKLRPVQKHLKSAHIVSDRRSASDIEGWSSSGESHYQSFEHTESPHSRPLSSDVELLLTGTAEFQSALTTQDMSTKSQRTSKDYVTAASTLSSRGSLKSLDSESSGHVASIDISDASETLVPSAAELKEELIESGNLGDQLEVERNKIKPIVIEELLEESIADVKHKEDLENENVKKTSSLDGLSQSEEGSLEDEINVHIDASSDVICKMKRSHEMSFQPKELLPEKFPSESFSESADLEMESEIPESDSQVFSMSKIETGPSTIRRIKESTEISNTSSSKTSEPSKSYEISEKTVEYRTSSIVYKTPEKKPKPVEEETVIERKVVTIKAEPMPVHFSTAPKQEVDYDSLMADIIPKGTTEYEEIASVQVLKSHSGTTVSSSSSSEKKTPEPYPIDSKQSSSSSLKIQDDHLSTPQTPISNPSQSSESTDNGREYVLDDMYEISEDQELFQSDRALTDSKSEISVTTEERTLYETQKEPDSPTSDEFEMIDKPSEIDDFVVIEEVAKEASEFDAEGKSVCIGKATFVKKHDEEVENYLSQTTKKSNETEYSTSGSLSEEELGQYELEQRRLRAAENAEIEAGKKWIQMQFEGDLAAARYEYDRGPLEDIKEEEMTDFDASRIGSFTSQKESIGSYGSIKNSFGSLSESDIMLRRRYMMRSGEQDDVSVSSLQEFENLEQILSLEAYQHSSSSQDSLNGSLPRRYSRGKNTQGDDVSMSSLKEFEGLESACLEALKIEIQAKQKEALLLSQDGRLSSAGFLDMEKRSYSHGSSESSPPQKSGSSPGQKSGSPSQKSGSPSQKSGSPGQKSGSPGQKYGSPSQKALADAIAIRKLIDQQMAEGADIKTSTAIADDGTTVTYVTSQKKIYDNKGAFYVPDATVPVCTESVCTKKATYECKGQEPCVSKTDDIDKECETDLGSSFTEADASMIGVITTTKVIQQRFVDGKKVSESIITSSGKGMDIPGAVKEDQSGEYGSGSFPSLEVGSGASMGDYGSEFSSSITSQQSDTESLVTMMEKPCDSEHGSELGSMERLESITVTTKVIVSPRQLDLDLNSKEMSDSAMREISPMSGKSGSGAFSSTASKHFTDPASGSWSGLDEDMSSSGSFSRAREDLMLGSTDSLEQTSSNATRATYNYEVDTPMTGSLTSAGSHTMVSSLDTLEPVTALFEKGNRALGLSTEDCFTMDHSGSDHIEEYEIQEPDSDSDKHADYGKPQARERTIMFEGRHSSEESSSGKGGATFFIGDTPITKGDKISSESSSGVTDIPPVPAQRKSLTGITKPIVLEQHKPKDDDKDNENV